MSNRYRIHVMRLAALGFSCTVVGMVAAPSANAAYTDYRCVAVGGADGLVDPLVGALFPPSAILGLNCKPQTGNGGKPVLLFAYKDGNPSYGCTSFNQPTDDIGLNIGAGAGCTPIAKPAATAQGTGLLKQRSKSRARARKSR